MDAQTSLQEFHKNTKKIMPKEPARYFLIIQTNDQKTINQTTFKSVQIFDHKKKIIIVYNSPLA